MRIAINDWFHFSELLRSDKQACLKHLQAREIYEATLRIPFPYKEADFETWMGIVEQATAEQKEPVHWAIRTSEDVLIGALGFEGLVIGKSHRAEVGYWLAKPYWGQGIMTAAVSRACQLAFERWGLAKITPHVFPHNDASARVLEKCGFRQEGYLTKQYLKEGQLLDARAYGLIRQDASLVQARLG